MKHPPSDPIGLVEHLTPFRVRGWAMDRRNPLIALDLVLRVDGVAMQWFRPQFTLPQVAAYLGWEADALGLVGFDVPLPEVCADGHLHHVEVTVAATGTVLQGATTRVTHCNPQLPLDKVPPAWWVNEEAAPRKRPRPLVTVAVLNRNGSGVLQALLQSWAAQHDQARVPVEWVVIDHASTDGSLAMLRGWQGRMDLRVKPLKTNASFSSSCNLAARMARAPYLLFLNNDIVWLHDALPAMLRTLQDEPDVGLVGLKLIKTSDAGPTGGAAFTEVQHLGVRFKQHEQGYWPYEATPSRAQREDEYLPQQVPAVTGAALLCRKADFDAVGGFDEAYFYGFEDVELCLRLTHRLGKRAVCRNDLAALHRHGYTRLTGRENPVTQRLQRNAQVLDRHMGLWLKRAWWRSLILADRNLTTEPLTIGLGAGCLPVPGEEPAPPLRAMLRLGEALRRSHPGCQVVLLHPGLDAYDARGLHVLVAASPRYDLRQLRNARADLRTIAWLQGKPAEWTAQPWWLAFDGYVAPHGRSAAAWARTSGMPVCASTPAQPLGRSLHAQAMPLRVSIHVPVGQGAPAHPARPAKARPAAVAQAAAMLHAALKREGVACWLHWADDDAPPTTAHRVVDARIHLLHSQCPPPSPWPLEAGCLHVAWQLTPSPGAAPVFTQGSAASAAPDLHLTGRDAPPRAADIARALESRLGRAFLAP